MNVELDPIEARIIGSLMEKSVVTPDQYPLSLNALVNACNQKSSREPVMALREREVAEVLERLQKRFLVREKSGFGGRVAKYHYRLYNDEIGDYRFSSAERALICLLLLRGPQTPGELKSRSGRLHEFADVDAVETTLQGLVDAEHGPFVTRLARQPGRREARYAQLFTGAAAETDLAETAPPATPRPAPQAALQAPLRAAPIPAPAATADSAGEERLARLEARVAALEAALETVLATRNREPGEG